jgi:hypothetical protein
MDRLRAVLALPPDRLPKRTAVDRTAGNPPYTVPYVYHNNRHNYTLLYTIYWINTLTTPIYSIHIHLIHTHTHSHTHTLTHTHIHIHTHSHTHTYTHTHTHIHTHTHTQVIRQNTQFPMFGLNNNLWIKLLGKGLHLFYQCMCVSQ